MERYCCQRQGGKDSKDSRFKYHPVMLWNFNKIWIMLRATGWILAWHSKLAMASAAASVSCRDSRRLLEWFETEPEHTTTALSKHDTER
ncbi:hypothetical protein MTO96_034100 [Rhipicephalus appendiculatus]